MNPALALGIYGVFFIVPFIVERVADVLQLRLAKRPLSPALQELQSPEDQKKSYAYARDRKHVEWISQTTSLIFWFFFWKMDRFENLAALSRYDLPFKSLWASGIAFTFLLAFIQGVIDLPFSVYSTFKIEVKYGFNRTTWKLFILDVLKGFLLSAVIGIPVLLLTYQFLEWKLPVPFVWLWLAYLGLQIFLLWIAPVVLLPLFLKLSPLPEGELKSAIEAYRQKQTFRLNGVWVCDASKRSSKSNAFFTGFGKFRRLVLFDTLIAQQSPEEITSIVAHEAGHFQKGHILKGIVLSAVTTFFFLWGVVSLVESPNLFFGFGFVQSEFFHYVYGLPLAVTVMGKFMQPLRFFTTALSRKHEFEADAFSVETTGSGEALARALKKLSRENLSGVQYHPLYTALHLSHPPLPDRLKALGSAL